MSELIGHGSSCNLIPGTSIPVGPLSNAPGISTFSDYRLNATGGDSIERMSDSTCPQTPGSDSISMCGLMKAARTTGIPHN